MSSNLLVKAARTGRTIARVTPASAGWRYVGFEALWLAGDTEDGDQIVPLRPVGRLAANQPVPLRDAIAALREAARPLQQMDDTMGA